MNHTNLDASEHLGETQLVVSEHLGEAQFSEVKSDMRLLAIITIMATADIYLANASCWSCNAANQRRSWPLSPDATACEVKQKLFSSSPDDFGEPQDALKEAFDGKNCGFPEGRPNRMAVVASGNSQHHTDQTRKYKEEAIKKARKKTYSNTVTKLLFKQHIRCLGDATNAIFC